MDRLWRLLQHKSADNILIIDKREVKADYHETVGKGRDNSDSLKLVTDLAQSLHELDCFIRENLNLSEEQKLDIAGDLATIQAQIYKNNPIVDIIRAAWAAVKSVIDYTETMDAARKVEYMIRDFL
jgi:hypothetical protein